MVKLNESKSNYMVFSRSNTEFATGLTINGNTIDRVEEVNLVGVWLTNFLNWYKNTHVYKVPQRAQIVRHYLSVLSLYCLINVKFSLSMLFDQCVVLSVKLDRLIYI